ncbi:ribonuclease III [Roseibium aquae]|uniref:Ribonuclease III n=1 Tax=Roseibium aquae TaxID=1323746 RepID=A0A916TKP9_9HYPH|nr:DUF2793 domain-containing protein [Roseibium aquae]GGB51048.1 ribonuclease III [Roseibium aquae]
MSETTRLKLPLLAAAQAQKHITHNEALQRADALMHLSFTSRTITAPPQGMDGQAFLVPAGASGEWSGKDGQVALLLSGDWTFVQPVDGMTAFVASEQVGLSYAAGQWRQTGAVLSDDTVLAQTALGAQSRHQIHEVELMDLSGASVAAIGLIPARAIVFCVSTRTSAAVTGASAYDCGIAGEPSKFGGSLGTAPGSTNLGVIGPTAFYSPTDVVLTAQGGPFTGGAVKVAAHVFLPVAPD